MEKHIVYLGLGSNLGDRVKNIEKALHLMEKNNIYVEEVSTFIETEPVGGPPQGNFINAVARVRTNLTPVELLKVLKKIEKFLGRDNNGIRWGPRPIDIDILLYDDITFISKELIIPHPRMALRDFVLKPLLEVLV